MPNFELLEEGDTVEEGDLTFNSGTWRPFASPRAGQRVPHDMVIVRMMRSEPNFVIEVWIDQCGIRANIQHMHTGYGYDKSFQREYDKPGQLAAMWESFRQEVIEFIDNFRKKRSAKAPNPE